MALISRGDFNSFFVQPSSGTLRDQPEAAGLDTFGTLSQVASVAAGEPMQLGQSAQPRGLALGALTLNKGFQSFLTRLFRRTSKVYFLSWAFDLSGNPPFLYPGTIAPASLIPLRDEQTREFIGQGAVLFPARPVTAGLTFRMQLWESRKGVRDFGATMQEVSDAVTKSGLNQLIAGLAALTGVPGATMSAIAVAGAELGGLIGSILARRGDDYADFFEGYFSASEDWPMGEERHKGYASEIVLVRMT
jgi:hypothetical protein